ncbi:MAG: Flp family type IVb pilin [Pirellulales bacterium]
MLRHVLRLIEEEEAPTMVEYALLVGFIALTAAAAVGTFGAALRDTYQSVLDVLPPRR